MKAQFIFTLGAGLLAAMAASPALAQDAAESAIILGGTGQSTGTASHSLGNAVRGSIGPAANAVNATNRSTGRASAGTFRGGGNPSGGGFRASLWSRPTPKVIPRGIDSLAGSNAPVYRLGNGRTIKVSGRLTPYVPTVCTRNCGA